MQYLDANVILRYILNDHPERSSKAKKTNRRKYFGKKSLDFVDCLLAAYYEIENISIHTFDTKLNNLLALIAETKKSTTPEGTGYVGS